MTRYASLTVDLDTLACYRDIHGLEPGSTDGPDAAYTVGVRRLLDFFEAARVPATLFVIGRDVAQPEHAALLEEAVERGFELANHTYSHYYDLPGRTAGRQNIEIARGEEAIESVAGQTPVGFRAPGYNVTAQILTILEERGYLYDSSIFSCPPYYAAKGAIMGFRRLTGRKSRSAMTPAGNLLAPLGPYRPDSEKPWQRDAHRRLIEVPMCVVPLLSFPIIGTSLHLLGKTGFDMVLPALKSTYDRILQLEFHAIDFMDAEDVDSDALVDAQPDLRVPWRKKRELYAHVIHRLREAYRFATLADAVQRA